MAGNQQVEAFYRYSFKPGDMRKNAIIGWWQYTYDGIPKINNGYSLYNNKWSKMFNTTSAFTKTSTYNTGINYPYLRYADVLLMYAEADLKLSGNVNADALDCVQQVRNRAYYGSEVSAPTVTAADANEFLNVILQERKWEFAFESINYWDLLRQGIDYAASQLALNLDVVSGGAPDNVAITAENVRTKKGLCQIPYNQITLSNNVLKQNAGW